MKKKRRKKVRKRRKKLENTSPINFMKNDNGNLLYAQNSVINNNYSLLIENYLLYNYQI